jgi:hypothetical protein
MSKGQERFQVGTIAGSESLTFGHWHVEAVKGHRHEAVEANEINQLIGSVLAERTNPTFPTGAPILEFCRRKLNLFKGR